MLLTFFVLDSVKEIELDINYKIGNYENYLRKAIRKNENYILFYKRTSKS